MSSADLLEDGFPHGTPEGYDQGCHSAGGCPTGREYGLSCKIAKMKSRGDGHYTRLVKGGATIPEIADALGLIGTAPTTAPAAVRKPKPTPKPTAPAVDAEPAPDAVPALDEPVDAAAAPTHTTREIRAWAIQKGYEVRNRGTIRQEIIDHYWEEHGLLDPATDDQPTVEEPVMPAPPVTPLVVAGAIAIKGPVDVVSDVRPDWGALNLENDLANATKRISDLEASLANAAKGITDIAGERDRARDLAARLGEELARLEEQRDQDRLTRAGELITEYRTIDQLQAALAAASASLHTTERALELVLQKWDDATRAATITDDMEARAAAVVAEVTGEPRVGRFERTMARSILVAALAVDGSGDA